MEIIKHGNTIKEYKCECGCEFIAFKPTERSNAIFFFIKCVIMLLALSAVM